MPGDTARVFEIFDLVSEVPRAERDHLLDELCADDALLRSQVEALLHAEAANPAFLEGGARDAVVSSQIDASPLDHVVEGQQVGRYKILDRLGIGGMGAVYLAERSDIGGRVALKLIRGDLADPSRRNRFLREQRVLARLSHPNIAKLLDAGVTADGTAYIAMEYVDGLNVLSHCDEQRLPIRARLELVEQIGRAVQHAHENFVVHRDLKPSNVYVGSDGAIKLLDFGIAKLVDDGGDADVETTRTGFRMATPAYAAPEQTHGGSITASTDVYALGVLTYELLTGRRPVGKPGDMVRRPSATVTEPVDSDRSPAAVASARQTTTDRLSRSLRGDLDTICLKALQEEAQRRYSSAQSFVDDIRRFLDGQPVTARPDSLPYRAAKFVRRNRVAVGVVCAVLVASVAFVALSLRHRTQLRAERDRAQTEAEAATRMTNFMTSVFSATDPRFRMDVDQPISSILEKAVLSVDEDLADDPEVASRMLVTLAHIRRNLGDLDGSRALLDTVETRYAGAPEFDRASGVRLYRALGEYQLERGLYDDARSSYQYALDLATESDEPVWRAALLSCIAQVEAHAGYFAKADSLYQLSADEYIGSVGAQHTNLAIVDVQRAGVLLRTRDYNAADSLLSVGLPVLQQKYGDLHWQLSSALNSRATVAFRTGQFELADSTLRWLIRLWKHVLPGQESIQLAHALNGYGQLLNETERFAAAVDTLERALQMSVALRGEVERENTAILNNLSIAYGGLGEVDEALAALERAMRINRQILREDHPSITVNLYNQATLMSKAGRHLDAARQFELVVHRDSVAFGNDHPEVAIDRLKLAGEYIELGRLQDARTTLEAAATVIRARFDARNRRLAEADELLGRLLEAEGDCDAAQAAFGRARDAFVGIMGESSASVARVAARIKSCP